MSTTQTQVYSALRTAAERIGANNFRRGVGVRRRGGRVVGFTPTPEHAEIVAALPRVLSGEISPGDGMALLWQRETMAQRLGGENELRAATELAYSRYANGGN